MWTVWTALPQPRGGGRGRSVTRTMWRASFTFFPPAVSSQGRPAGSSTHWLSGSVCLLSVLGPDWMNSSCISSILCDWDWGWDNRPLRPFPSSLSPLPPPLACTVCLGTAPCPLGRAAVLIVVALLLHGAAFLSHLQHPSTLTCSSHVCICPLPLLNLMERNRFFP